MPLILINKMLAVSVLQAYDELRNQEQVDITAHPNACRMAKFGTTRSQRCIMPAVTGRFVLVQVSR